MPLKTKVDKIDIQRVLSAMMKARYLTAFRRLPQKTDRDLFLEAVERYRLEPRAAIKALKRYKPQVYAKLFGNSPAHSPQ